MSSTTLSLQFLSTARPLVIGNAARALVDALAALPRVALDAATKGLRARRLAASSQALRERAQALQATDPSFAADLLAAAGHLQNVVEQA